MRGTIRVIIALTIAALVLGSCVLPGTGTINVRNRLSGDRRITALYIYPAGSPDTVSEISSPMDYNDVHSEIGVEPGAWTVESIVDGGPDRTLEDVTVTEGTIDVIWIVDSDVE